MRSPIARLIDAATGYKPTPARERVRIECPTCGRRQFTQLQDGDPPHTRTVIANCPDCCQAGDEDRVEFFDEKGKRIPQ
ncbi:hypothetical protein [Thiocapsa sp. N5-Cardenillas]|uniref:hypothetical protein n=1 Tax=Thiocapsa sp. N5-Cardenillas TaxID=3137397 RepID=UPI0035AEAF3F